MRSVWTIEQTLNRNANILLIEGMKNGKPGLKILDPIYSHNEKNEYSEELKKFLRMNG